MPSSVSTDSGWNCTPSAGQLAVADPHHDALAARAHLEAVRELVGDDQRVVAPDRQRRRQARDRSCARRARSPRSCRAPGGGGRRCRRTPARAPGGRGRRRASGSRPAGKRRTTSSVMPASFGRARARRDDDAVGRAREQLVDARAVVAHDLELGAELAEVLHEVVGEGVVVVDHEDAHATSLASLAARAATSRRGCAPCSPRATARKRLAAPG